MFFGLKLALDTNRPELCNEMLLKKTKGIIALYFTCVKRYNTEKIILKYLLQKLTIHNL